MPSCLKYVSAYQKEDLRSPFILIGSPCLGYTWYYLILYDKRRSEFEFNDTPRSKYDFKDNASNRTCVLLPFFFGYLFDDWWFDWFVGLKSIFGLCYPPAAPFYTIHDERCVLYAISSLYGVYIVIDEIILQSSSTMGVVYRTSVIQVV